MYLFTLLNFFMDKVRARVNCELIVLEWKAKSELVRFAIDSSHLQSASGWSIWYIIDQFLI